MIGVLTMLMANWKLLASVAGAVTVFALLAAGAAYEHHQGYSDGYSVAHQQPMTEATSRMPSGARTRPPGMRERSFFLGFMSPTE